MPPLSRRRRKAALSSPADPLPRIVRLWMLRVMVHLGGHTKLIGKIGFCDDDVASAVGLARWRDDDIDGAKRREILSDLRVQLARAEASASRSQVPRVLRNNVAKMAALAGLSEPACRILEFAVLLHNSLPLIGVTDLLGNLTTPKLFRALAVILDLPVPGVAQAFAPQAALAQSGLLQVNRAHPTEIQHKLNLLSDSFADYVSTPASDPMHLIRDVVIATGKSSLALGDFHHIGPSLRLLIPYLRNALARSGSGVNVFIYGPPGTGKTELARVIAAAVGCTLYDVASEDSDGDPIGGEKRLCALRTAQNFLVEGGAITVFDEAEDVFSGDPGLFGRKSVAQLRKAWVNRLLENNRVPVIWLSNDVHSLDPAFVRRFDFVIELPVPPKRQRERMIGRACSGLLVETGVRRLAESESLSPAVVSRAAAVVNSIRSDIAPDDAQDAVEILVGNTLEAQGHARPRREDPNRLPETYDPAYVTADADLVALADGLALSRAGRLCLYGPPGTGKTAYGRWIAERLDLPLEVRRTSDLMSKWLGDSEKNIARAFRQTEQAKSILLIDEVDSFLQDRRGAQRSWEVTQVNEMLTEMESYAGIFIASTNLVDGMDPAALRRFDLKVKFGFLQPQQACRLLRQTCQALDLAPPLPELETAVARLEVLTPGDFAAVRRQSRFRPLVSAAEFVSALEAECLLKTGGRRKLGF